MVNIENLSQLDLQLDEHHETVQHFIDMREQRLVNLAQARIQIEPVAPLQTTADGFSSKKLPLHYNKRTLMQRLQ